MTTNNSSLKTIVLNPGECVNLPQGAVVTAIILDGAASVTSSCGSLPTPSSYKCGSFFLWIDCDANSGHSMDESCTYYTSLKIGGTTYIINEKVVTGDNCGTPVPVGTLNLHITDSALFEFTSVTQDTGPKKSGIELFFKCPEPLFNTLELKVDNCSSTQYYKPQEVECP